MDLQALFSLTTLLVLPFWALMVALPHWRPTRRLLASPLVAVPPAVVYALLALPRLPQLLADLSAPTLAAVARLLGTPEGAALAWAHFLAVDLFVGRWAYLDSRERGISAWLMAPVLFAVLMVGPLGLLAYLLVRAPSARRPAGRPIPTPASPA